MDLNENSSKEEILKYLEESAYSFLFCYLNKSWAQPYLDEAAKKTAKRDSYSFLLNFSDKPWAQPYIDETAKEAAKENPKYFLEEWIDDFPQYINLALFSLGDKNVSK